MIRKAVIPLFFLTHNSGEPSVQMLIAVKLLFPGEKILNYEP